LTNDTPLATRFTDPLREKKAHHYNSPSKVSRNHSSKHQVVPTTSRPPNRRSPNERKHQSSRGNSLRKHRRSKSDSNTKENKLTSEPPQNKPHKAAVEPPLAAPEEREERDRSRTISAPQSPLLRNYSNKILSPRHIDSILVEEKKSPNHPGPKSAWILQNTIPYPKKIKKGLERGT